MVAIVPETTAAAANQGEYFDDEDGDDAGSADAARVANAAGDGFGRARQRDCKSAALRVFPAVAPPPPPRRR